MRNNEMREILWQKLQGGQDMTLDEAIKHCEEVAEEQSRLYSLCPCPCDGTKDCMSLKNGKDMGCTKCAADHRQLAEWLTELKEAKRLLRLAIEDIDNARHGINCGICGMQSCDINNVMPECKYRWQYADEAEKLLKEK